MKRFVSFCVVCFCTRRDAARVLVSLLRAAVCDRPVQQLEVSVICRVHTRGLVPRAAVRMRPLKHLEVSALCRVRARPLVPRAAVCARNHCSTSRCFSGCTQTTARRTCGCARTRRRAGTSRCCSGCAESTARGTQARALGRRRAGISRCYSGCARTAVRGTLTRTMPQEDICWSGRWRTAYPHTENKFRGLNYKD
jgi:hypothetical protein